MVQKMESLEDLKSQEMLNISVYSELKVLPGLPETTSLKVFRLERCHKLEKANGLESLLSLEMLKIWLHPKLDEHIQNHWWNSI